MDKSIILKSTLMLLLVCGVFVWGCQQSENTGSTGVTNGDTTEVQQEETMAADTLLETEEAIRSTSQQVERLDVPSPQQVDSLRDTAYNLYEADSCSTAVEALKTHAEKANWLANVISKGLEPFYDASYDEQKNVSMGRIRILGNFEDSANELKRERNESYIMIAECEREMGNQNLALIYYMSALDLIDVEDQSLWDRARTGLYETVGVD
jgi:hypothetical protein